MRNIAGAGLLAALLLVAMTAMTGCGDNSVTNTTDEGEHLEAFGVRVLDGETQLAEADGTDVTGSLTATVGDTSEWYNVWFMDDAGEWFNPVLADSVEEVDIAHTLIVRFTEPKADAIVGNYADGTKWRFKLTGLEAGNTTVRFVVTHHEHDDYVSPEIPVQIEAAQ